MTSMFRMEQWRERSEGGVIEKGEDLGDDETSLGFPPFCATCEKQIATSDASQLFCSEACRLCDSKLEANGTTRVRLDWKYFLDSINIMDSSPPLENGDWPTLSRRTSRTLRKYTDYSIRQIAQRTGIPKSTVFDYLSAPIEK
ncbi:hypothetical protein V502_00353 [Pseudogymnoascus sp. VKM F-4520 (FW-2644)]|nr:hypothetical protein V502_00353 [Pseudogymnoascus sp. VKM F-4520 (FW-2644)]